MRRMPVATNWSATPPGPSPAGARCAAGPGRRRWSGEGRRHPPCRGCRPRPRRSERRRPRKSVSSVASGPRIVPCRRRGQELQVGRGRGAPWRCGRRGPPGRRRRRCRCPAARPADHGGDGLGKGPAGHELGRPQGSPARRDQGGRERRPAPGGCRGARLRGAVDDERGPQQHRAGDAQRAGRQRQASAASAGPTAHALHRRGVTRRGGPGRGVTRRGDNRRGGAGGGGRLRRGGRVVVLDAHRRGGQGPGGLRCSPTPSCQEPAAAHTGGRGR